jgi:CheY-like chemotaxis protein
MRILLAEDNADNRDMLVRRLQRKGYEVFVAVDGGEAVEQAARCAPDVILMDISMPVMSGLEATAAIRAAGPAKYVPIIALTAHAMESDRQKCFDAGCSGFATKPVDFKALVDLIENSVKGIAA